MEVQLDDPRVPALQATATPYALIGRTADPSDSVHVDIDFEQSTREALQHLHDLGHRHIVFVTGTQDRKSYYNYGPYVRTERAFRQVTARLGVAPVVVESGQDTTAGRDLAHRLFTECPDTTAVLVLDEFAAIGLLTGVIHRGVRVPEDVSIMSMLTSDDMATYTQPSLTIMRSPGPGLGELAVKHLVRQMKTGERPDPVLLPSTLVPGESTAAPPAVPYGRR
jgi:DNA-binding LacI/PurR family transcriptional regulator